MKALCWHGTGDVRVDTVPDPTIEDPRDAVIKITSTAICGSDLHLFDGFLPTMEKGDILGHEPMGDVVEVGSGVTKLKMGDRVVVPFTIGCGECFFCQKGLFSCCDTSNPNAEMAEGRDGPLAGGALRLLAHAGRLRRRTGRVPARAVCRCGPDQDPDGLPDEKVLFLSDIFPTGYMAAENCGIEPGDTVAVWGCGPVGQFAIQSAWMLGAGRVIAIDRVPERLRMAEQHGKAETINFDDVKVYDRLMEMTSGRGPDRCIDAVGAEAHGSGSFDAIVDKAKAAVMLAPIARTCCARRSCAAARAERSRFPASMSACSTRSRSVPR